MSLEIPLPTASPYDDPGQYTPLLLSAIGVFLMSPDIWDQTDYPAARQYMGSLMSYIVELMETDILSNPVGATMTWHTATPPSRWLICDGQSVLKADYPALWSLWGGKYGSTTTHFNVIDLRDKSPMGGGGSLVALDAIAGAATVVLSTPNLPAHTHTTRIVTSGAAGANNALVVTQANVNTTPTTNVSNPTGDGTAHNNLSPVKGVHFIVYAGRAAA